PVKLVVHGDALADGFDQVGAVPAEPLDAGLPATLAGLAIAYEQIDQTMLLLHVRPHSAVVRRTFSATAACGSLAFVGDYDVPKQRQLNRIVRPCHSPEQGIDGPGDAARGLIVSGGKSERLRLSEVRAVFRLVGECRELGADHLAWRGHLAARLGSLVGGQAGMA